MAIAKKARHLDNISNQETVKKKFASSIGWMAINKVVTQIGTWIVTILLARILNPSDYGLVGMATLVSGVVSLTGDFGLSVSLIQKKELTEEETSAMFWQYLVIGCCLTVLMYVLAPLGAKFWGEPELVRLMRLLSISFFFNALSEIPAGLLKRKMKFKEFGLVMSIAAMAGSLVSISSALLGFGAASLVFGIIAISVVKSTLVFVWEPFRPKLIFRTKESGSHLKFGATVTGQRYLWWLYSEIDFWLASKFLGKDLYGIYSMAFYMASAPMEKLYSVLQPVLLPAFSRFEKRDELIDFFFVLVKKSAYLAFPVFLLLFWVADDLIIVLLGKKWEAAIPIFKVIVLLSSIRLISDYHSPLLNAIGRPDVGLKNMALGAVLAIIAFSIGVQYGIQGLIIAWLIFYPVFITLYVVSLARVVGFRVKDYFHNLFKPVLLNTLMSLTVFVCISGFKLSPYLSADSSVPAILRIGIISFTALLAYLLFFYYLDRELFSWCKGFITRKKKLIS